MDLLLESIRAFITFIIFAYLLWVGRNKELHKQKGWWYIVGGFFLILFCTLIDITDNFPFLNQFIWIGNTGYRAFLEEVIGGLFGSVLIAIGFWKWMPTIITLKKTQNELAKLNVDLEIRVEERTSKQLALTDQLKQEIKKHK